MPIYDLTTARLYLTIDPRPNPKPSGPHGALAPGGSSARALRCLIGACPGARGTAACIMPSHPASRRHSLPACLLIWPVPPSALPLLLLHTFMSSLWAGLSCCLRSRRALSTSRQLTWSVFLPRPSSLPLPMQEKALGHCCQVLQQGHQCQQPGAWLDDVLAAALAVVDGACAWPNVPAVAARPVLASLWPPLEAVLNRCGGVGGVGRCGRDRQAGQAGRQAGGSSRPGGWWRGTGARHRREQVAEQRLNWLKARRWHKWRAPEPITSATVSGKIWC